jgi:3-hydroxyisobutyrate dehydrogenase
LKSLQVPLPLAGLVHQLIQGLIGRGRGDDGFAARLEPKAASAGLELLSENADISDGLDPAGTNEDRS